MSLSVVQDHQRNFNHALAKMIFSNPGLMVQTVLSLIFVIKGSVWQNPNCVVQTTQTFCPEGVKFYSWQSARRTISAT
jgi:hypothetical protein